MQILHLIGYLTAHLSFELIFNQVLNISKILVVMIKYTNHSLPVRHVLLISFFIGDKTLIGKAELVAKVRNLISIKIFLGPRSIFH